MGKVLFLALSMQLWISNISSSLASNNFSIFYDFVIQMPGILKPIFTVIRIRYCFKERKQVEIWDSNEAEFCAQSQILSSSLQLCKITVYEHSFSK